MGRSHGRRRVFFYGCLAHAKRGATVCNNALVLRVERVDAAVVTALRLEVLRPVVVPAVIDGVFASLKATASQTSMGALRITLRDLDQKIAHLTDAVGGGAAVAPLVKKLQARQPETRVTLHSGKHR